MIYKSNANKVLGDLSKKLKAAQIGFDKELRIIASTTMAEVMYRVFNTGRATNARSIGNYSTKPTLVGAKSFVNKTAWNRVFKDKNLRWVTKGKKRLKLLPGGYRMIRSIEGKEVAYVNLQRTGKLKSSFVMEPITGGWAIGFLPYGAKISLYQEQHWGKLIWETSSREKKIINQLATKYIAKKLQ